MPKTGTLTKKPAKQVATRLYHHVFCEQMKELTIKLTKKGQRLKADFAIIAVSSKETIRTGLKAVDASPFKTVFVVDETSGQVLFALSQKRRVCPTVKEERPRPSSTSATTVDERLLSEVFSRRRLRLRLLPQRRLHLLRQGWWCHWRRSG